MLIFIGFKQTWKYQPVHISEIRGAEAEARKRELPGGAPEGERGEEPLPERAGSRQVQTLSLHVHRRHHRLHQRRHDTGKDEYL